MAETVARSLENNRHLVVEAGTGLGKTIAYLLPAAVYASQNQKRIVVSTYTLNLQQQIIEKDLPLLNAVLPFEFTAVLVKGRGNYLCFRRLARAISRVQSLFVDPDVIGTLEKIRQWGKANSDGSLSEIDFRVPGWLWNQVSSEQGNCLGKRCVFFDRCHYWRARRRMQHANILVVNHALLFSELAAQREGIALLGKYDCAIIDEAHNIENVAGEHFGIYLSEAQLYNTLNNLYHPKYQKGLLATIGASPAIEAVETAGRAAKELFSRLREMHQGRNGNEKPMPPNMVANPLTPALNTLAEEMRFVRSELGDEEDRFEFNNYRERLKELAGEVETFITQSKQPYTYWIESSGPAPEAESQRALILRAAPITVAQDLRETLFDRLKSVILTSATLSIGGAEG